MTVVAPGAAMEPRETVAPIMATGIGTAMAISEAMAIRAVAPREAMKPRAAAISMLGG